MNIIAAIVADQNIDPAFRRVLSLTHAKRRHDCHNSDFTVSAFSPERWAEIGAEELAAQRDDARFERIWGPLE